MSSPVQDHDAGLSDHSSPRSSALPSRPPLGLLDAVSLVVGIIVGAGIFRLPKDVFANTPSAAAGLGLWVLGGVLAFVGALCYAELASTYPIAGGEYVYLRRAYGPFAGFCFAWAQLMVIRTGASVAPIAYVFGEYARELYDFGPHSKLIYVTASIVGLTLVNALGIHPGRRTQNLLTLAKLLGLGGVVLAGLWLYVQPSGGVLLLDTPASTTADGSLALALVAVLWAYSGWHETVYVVGDLRDRSRNLVPALLLGVLAVAAIYVAFNAALLAGLGLATVRQSEALGAVLFRRAFGRPGEVALTVLVVVSALGAINGMILTGGRFFAGFGELHPGFGWLGAGRTRRGAPLAALIAQAAVSLGMVGLVETGTHWRGWVADEAPRMGIALPLDFTAPADGFSALMAATAPVFWFFFLLTAGALLVLRVREPDRPRPFRVPLFPVVSVVFAGTCLLMLYASTAEAVRHRPAEAAVVAALMLLGLPAYALTRSAEWRPRGEGEHGSDAEKV